MFKNYMKVAARNLRNHPGYTFINISGLAVGASVCLLMLVYIQRELSYDRFHDKADRIFGCYITQRHRARTVLA